VKKNLFILDELGRLCLKASNSHDLIEKPFGNDDFLGLHFEGEELGKLMKDKGV